MNFFEGKHVLITGATGLVGSNMVERLMTMDGVKVTAIGRNERKIRVLFEKFYSDPRFSFFIQDALQPLPNFKEPVDFIINAIGGVSGSEISNRPFGVIEANVSSTLNSLNFLRDQNENTAVKGKAIIVSSATVYSDSAHSKKRSSEDDTGNTTPLNAKNAPYSETKRFLEVLGNSYYKQYGVECIVARPSYIYGFSRFNADTAFYQFIKDAIAQNDISIRASSLQRRDNIYIDDLIDGILCICEHGISGEAYNISSNGESGGFAAINELAEVIVEIANNAIGSCVKVEYPNAKTDICGGLLLDNAKLKALGWKLKNDIHSGIGKTIRKYLSVSDSFGTENKEVVTDEFIRERENSGDNRRHIGYWRGNSKKIRKSGR